MSLAYAKTLATIAGLPIRKEKTLDLSAIEEMERWFKSYSAPVLEHYILNQQEAEEVDQQKEAVYAQNRSQSFRSHMEGKHLQRTFGRVTRHFCGKKLHVWRYEPTEPGFYFWQKDGKKHQSWMGSRQMSIKTPKQIGGYLAAKYPNHDIQINSRGYMNSSAFVDTTRMDPITVPVYEVFITPKLPGWYQTAERLLLEGKLLDRESAKALWDKYQAGELEQQEYAEHLARLCRQAEPFDDDPPTGWVDLDNNGRFVERALEERPSMHTDDAYRDYEEALKLYDDESEEFDDLDDDRQISLMLGMSTEQIEEASEVASTTDEFLRAAWTTPKKQTTLEGEDDLDW